MNGFVSDAIHAGHDPTNPISMFDSTTAPIINTLAKEFAVFDRWFCSIPGPTDPNRAFSMSGTSMGVVTNFNGTAWSQQSYMDYLRAQGRSIAGYYQHDVWALHYFEDLRKPENNQFIKEMAHFYEDLKGGNLANFVWLQPSMTTSASGQVPTWQHPDASVMEGERLIKNVYEALRASPMWSETAFIITYDEHGGFYDHGE
jgi:phospholipase C